MTNYNRGKIIHLNFRSTSSHLLTSETNCLWKLAASGLRSINWTHPELLMLIPSRGENCALQPTKLPQLRYAAVGSLRRYEEPAFCHQLRLEHDVGDADDRSI